MILFIYFIFGDTCQQFTSKWFIYLYKQTNKQKEREHSINKLK